MTTTTKIKTLAELEAAVREHGWHYHPDSHSTVTAEELSKLISQLKESWKENVIKEIEFRRDNKIRRGKQTNYVAGHTSAYNDTLKLLKSFGGEV